MSFAFGALLIVLLLLPGVALRYAYIRSNSIRRSLDFSLFSEAVIMIGAASGLHAIGLGIAKLLGYALNFRLLYLFATGGPLEAADYTIVERGYGTFILYLAIVSLVGGAVGYGLQRFVLDRGYDQRHKGLRVLNDWDRYFTGYVLSDEQRKKVNLIWIDLLVDGSGGNAVLYSGVLENYTLNREQTIDQIFISGAIRRHNLELSGVLSGKDEDALRPPNYDMPGSYLVIPFRQVRNLNISYHLVEKVREQSAPPAG